MNRRGFTRRTESGTVNKELIWHSSARETVQGFSDEAKSKIGFALRKLQNGELLSMPEARPMNVIAFGAFELRVRGKDGIFRVFYFLKRAEGIYVFHAFQKKTEKTPLEEIKVAQKRLQEMLE